ncbi:hypothetical protein LJK88_13615 [Paenibacillus sp. P26]|nr:hypothetical protein LJK88_13615 [Paenibacillus sp. P26]
MNYSVHPVVMCEETSLISGDFVGMAINKINAEYGGTGLFLQGSLGDQNPVYCHEPQEVSIRNLIKLSDKLAGIIKTALDNAVPITIDTAEVNRVEIALPQNVLERSTILRNLKLAEELYKHFEESPKSAQRRVQFERDVNEAVWAKYDERPLGVLKTELQAMKFGELLIVAHPTELFYSYHVEIEQHFLPNKTFIIGQANDSVGYVPTPDKYDVSSREYSYPAWFTSFMYGQLPFAKDVGSTLTNELIKLGQSFQKSKGD